MSEYKIHENCRDNDQLRTMFYDCIKAVFPGIDFKTWHDRGFWTEHYIPHAIVRDNKMIANVSASTMNIILNGQKVRGVQIGTVATLPEFRNQGLSRYLMEYVLHKYDDTTDLFFLFANETVLDFYPKFGFKRYDEVVFKTTAGLPSADYSARKLSVDSDDDIALIRRLLADRLPLTALFGAVDYDFITWWHILNIFPDKLYYLPDNDILFIISEKDDQLHIWDIVFTKPFDLIPAISQVIQSDSLKSVRYYFAPDRLGFEYTDTEPCPDSPLFVRGAFDPGAPRFKLPLTAQT